MRVGVLGLGKLGKPVALCIAHQGHEVIGYDPVASRMTLRPEDHPEIECGYGEFGTLQDYIKGADIGITFAPLHKVVETADILFVAVQTPHDPLYEGATMLPASRKDFDYRYLKDTLEQIVAVGRTTPFDLCVISTVLPGTYDRELKPILDKMPNARYFYTPQFIAMGTVMKDFLACPEPWLIGSDSYERGSKPSAGDQRISDFFGSLHAKPRMVMSVASAEACKVSYNTYITSKITIANSIMDMCERVAGADCDDVADFLQSCSHRITSSGYMRPGMGDGGACHGRDNIALSWLARELKLPYDLYDAMMKMREEQAGLLAAELHRVACETALPICILGTAFKPNVGIETGSSALLVADILKTRHRRDAHLYDPHIDERVWSAFARPHAYLVGCDHAAFDRLVLPEGSVLIDPFRKNRLARGSKVKVIAYGRGE